MYASSTNPPTAFPSMNHLPGSSQLPAQGEEEMEALIVGSPANLVDGQNCRSSGSLPADGVISLRIVAVRTHLFIVEVAAGASGFLPDRHVRVCYLQNLWCGVLRRPALCGRQRGVVDERDPLVVSLYGYSGHSAGVLLPMPKWGRKKLVTVHLILFVKPSTFPLSVGD